MLNQLELLFGRYNGGQIAPIGSYFNPRTMGVYQLTADGTLPLDGTFVRIDASGSQTLANIATTINTAIGTTYTAASLHIRTGADASPSPGQMCNDA